MTLEEHIDIDRLGIHSSGKLVENAALRRYDGGDAVMLCKHGDQFLRRYIICIQLHGSQFPEPGNFRNDIVQFVFLGFPFGYLVLDGTLPFFQDPFLHSVLLQCRRIPFVVLRFIEIDGLDH